MKASKPRRGGARPGAGRKPGPYKKKAWMIMIRPEFAQYIAGVAKASGLTIGDLITVSVRYRERERSK